MFIIKLLFLILIALVLVFLGYLAYMKKWLTKTNCIVAGIGCAVVLALVGVIILPTDKGNGPEITKNPEEVMETNRSEETRKMDMIMWYDIDTGPSSNDRPQKGWWPLYPGHPDIVTQNGNYRTTNPLLGLYDQRDPETARQHLYWMATLGCNGIAVDWTNYSSYRAEPVGGSWWKYTHGLYANTEVLLNAAKEETDFEPPKTYITVRYSGDSEKLKAILDDVYTLYEQYPQEWYFLDDGTENADKPFVVIFIDRTVFNEFNKTGLIYIQDERFNIRFSNGFWFEAGVDDENGYRKFDLDLPIWLFVENNRNEKDGLYKAPYVVGADGKVEQMIAWASVWHGGTNWDEMNNIINGKTTFERTLNGVEELQPKTLLINRFNYALAWLEQPQEGVSLMGSTHIEPNEDIGFLVFDNVMENLYKLNKWKGKAPDVGVKSGNGNKVYLTLDGFVTEYKIYIQGQEGQWVYYNVNEGITIPEEWAGNTVYIQGRNVFGEGAVTEYVF